MTHSSLWDSASLEALADSLVDSHTTLMSELVRMRHEHGLRQEDVAERMGVSQPTVASFEHYDANPTLSTIRRYAHAVGARIEHRVVDDCEVVTSTRFSYIVSTEFEFTPVSGFAWEVPANA